MFSKWAWYHNVGHDKLWSGVVFVSKKSGWICVKKFVFSWGWVVLMKINKLVSVSDHSIIGGRRLTFWRDYYSCVAPVLLNSVSSGETIVLKACIYTHQKYMHMNTVEKYFDHFFCSGYWPYHSSCKIGKDCIQEMTTKKEGKLNALFSFLSRCWLQWENRFSCTILEQWISKI